MTFMSSNIQKGKIALDLHLSGNRICLMYVHRVFAQFSRTWKGLRGNQILGQNDNTGPHDVTIY
jgi:hypothetical protein